MLISLMLWCWPFLSIFPFLILCNSCILLWCNITIFAFANSYFYTKPNYNRSASNSLYWKNFRMDSLHSIQQKYIWWHCDTMQQISCWCLLHVWAICCSLQIAHLVAMVRILWLSNSHAKLSWFKLLGNSYRVYAYILRCLLTLQTKYTYICIISQNDILLCTKCIVMQVYFQESQLVTTSLHDIALLYLHADQLTG